MTKRPRLLAPALAVASASLMLLGACGEDDYVAPPATTRGPGDLEGPTWLLDLGSVDVEAPEAVSTIRFLEGQVNGVAGCNTFRGTYTLDGGDLTIGPLASTRIGCPPPLDALERVVLERLARVTNYRIEGTSLVLRADDETLLRYQVNEPSVEGAWTATGVLIGSGFSSIILDTEITAAFDEDGALSGTGGCNTYRGEYTIDGTNINIGEIASTRIACEENILDQEQAYFAALEAATTWDQVGRELTLFDTEGRRVVTFTKS